MDFAFQPGSAPLLISIPHAGTDIPDELAARMTPQALARADTDWHLPRLYDFASVLGASVLAARWSRQGRFCFSRGFPDADPSPLQR